MAREPLTRFNLGAALLCLAGIALVALDSLVVNRGDALTLVGAVFFALQIATQRGMAESSMSTLSRSGCFSPSA